jgi:hypothetical protein
VYPDDVLGEPQLVTRRAPACGPDAVAAVPAKIVNAPNGASARIDQTAALSVARARDPGSCALCQASATAAISAIIDRQKCAITNPGARCSRTVKPPSTACAKTNTGRLTASHARSRRTGSRVNASTAAATVITPTKPEIARLPNSIGACVLSGGNAPPPHLRRLCKRFPKSAAPSALVRVV